MAKDKKELNPEIVESKAGLSNEELNLMSKAIESGTVVLDDKEDKSIFKAVITGLNSVKNISMKTEYLNVRENYTGVKLEFMAKMGNMPYLDTFVKIFETKRVSYQRKGRQEDVMIMQERHREEERDKSKELAKMFGIS